MAGRIPCAELERPLKLCATAFAVIGLITSPVATAGPYADDLGKCLVASTTREDRVTLARWIFIAFAAHPSVARISSTKPSDVDSANAQVGSLFTKLLTESCSEKTKSALQNEGPSAIQLGFQVLGQVAGVELASSPEVQERMSGIIKFIDNRKLESLGKLNHE